MQPRLLAQKWYTTHTHTLRPKCKHSWWWFTWIPFPVAGNQHFGKKERKTFTSTFHVPHNNINQQFRSRNLLQTFVPNVCHSHDIMTMTMTCRFSSTSNSILHHSRSQLRPTNWDFYSANSPPLRPCHQPSFLAEKDVRFILEQCLVCSEVVYAKDVYHSDVTIPKRLNDQSPGRDASDLLSYTPCSWLTL